MVRKHEGNTLGRHRRKWDDNIKVDTDEVGCGIDWNNMNEDGDRWWAVDSAVPVGFSRRIFFHGVS